MTDYSGIVPDKLELGCEPWPRSPRAPVRTWDIGFFQIVGDKSRGLSSGPSVYLTSRMCWHGMGELVEERDGIVRIYEIADARNGPIGLDTKALKRDLSEGGELAVLLDRIVDGFSVGLDDRYPTSSNLEGFVTPDARQAESELRRAIRENGYVL